MLAKKPYDKSPYEVFKDLRAPWLSELTYKVTQAIDAYDAFLNDEAKLDGVPGLANEDYLYERFKDNVFYGMWFGNWQVLKYFNIIMRKKMYKELIGEWTFTEHDVEMYEFFRTCKVDKSHKCTWKQLKYNSKLAVDVSDYLSEIYNEAFNARSAMHSAWCNSKYPAGNYCFYIRENQRKETGHFTVFHLLENKDISIDKMIEHCKMLVPKLPELEHEYYNYHYFKAKTQWVLHGWGTRDFCNDVDEVFLSKKTLAF